MMRRHVLATTLLTAVIIASPLGAQSVAERLAAGDRAYDALHPAEAIVEYEAAIQADSTSAEASWKAARSTADLAESEKNGDRQAKLFSLALAHAERAVRFAPNDAEAQFNLSRALGLKALSVGVLDRTKFGVAVHEHAVRALEIDPKHPGALHVVGEWNAQIMRLNGMQRFMAKNMMGGRVFGEANWANALSYLERAVAIDPNRLTHRLALAKVYLDRDQKAKAREQLELVANGEVRDVNDPIYKKEAAQLLAKIK